MLEVPCSKRRGEGSTWYKNVLVKIIWKSITYSSEPYLSHACNTVMLLQRRCSTGVWCCTDRIHVQHGQPHSYYICQNQTDGNYLLIPYRTYEGCSKVSVARPWRSRDTRSFNAWELSAGQFKNIYQEKAITQLWLNGARMCTARLPSKGKFTLCSDEAWLLKRSYVIYTSTPSLTMLEEAYTRKPYYVNFSGTIPP